MAICVGIIIFQTWVPAYHLSRSAKDRPAEKKEGPAPNVTVSPPISEDPQARMEKDARKLRKKIRECDSLVEKEEKGEALTDQEKEKIQNLRTW